MIIYSAIEVFLLLVASSVVAEKARRLRRSAFAFHLVYWDVCDWYDEYRVPCSNVEAAVVSLLSDVTVKKQFFSSCLPACHNYTIMVQSSDYVRLCVMLPKFSKINAIKNNYEVKQKSW